MSTQNAPLELSSALAYSERLKEQFKKLNQRQQAWLLMRFPTCQTDNECTARLRESESGVNIPERTVSRWKRDNSVFRDVYDLMSTNLVDVAAHINSTEVSEAIKVAMREALALLQTTWSDLHSKEMVKAKTDLIVHFTGGKAHSVKSANMGDGDDIRKLSKVIE